MNERAQICAKSRVDGSWFPIALTSIFCLFEINNLLHHPLWRDELQTWMMVRSSHSIAQLLFIKRYEGHPDLWFLVLYFASRFTANPLAMQVVHLLIASSTVYVVARYAPFTSLQKVLFAFGYFPFFEYATISRNYALGVLFVFCFCAAYRPGIKKNYLLLSVFLSLAAQTSIYGLIVAASLALVMLSEVISEFLAKPTSKNTLSSESRKSFDFNVSGFVSAAVLFVCAICASVLSSRQPADGGLYFAQNPWLYTATMISRSFIPIPRITVNFWNTNILHTYPMVFLSAVLLAVTVWLLARKTAALIGYAAGLVCFLLFNRYIHAGAVRYDGHAFILFIACWWLASCYPVERPAASVDNSPGWLRAHQGTAICALLGMQVVAGLVASCLAFRTPFSRGRDVARYITDNHMENMFIVGDRDYSASTVAGYLNREIYYASGNRSGTYIVWDNKRVGYFPQTAMRVAEQKALEQKRDVLAVMSYPSDTSDPNVSKLASFTGAVVHDETYYLYLVRYAGTFADGSR